MTTRIEHLNITVSDADRTAAMLVDLFDWTIRWKGEAKDSGTSIHVGGPENGDDYLAIYTPPSPAPARPDGQTVAFINHVGVLVDDLDEIERRVIAAELTPHSHGDYEPGRRFYFDDPDGIEFEVVSYS